MHPSIQALKNAAINLKGRMNAYAGNCMVLQEEEEYF